MREVVIVEAVRTPIGRRNGALKDVHPVVLAAMLGLVGVGAGCATIRGDRQKMTIETEPAGANLVVDGQKYMTPAEVVLKRKEAHRITVDKDGYRPIAFNLESTWDGASMTDLALPGGSALMGASVVTGS